LTKGYTLTIIENEIYADDNSYSILIQDKTGRAYYSNTFLETREADTYAAAALMNVLLKNNLEISSIMRDKMKNEGIEIVDTEILYDSNTSQYKFVYFSGGFEYDTNLIQTGDYQSALSTMKSFTYEILDRAINPPT
jgi:hypothetical protein